MRLRTSTCIGQPPHAHSTPTTLRSLNKLVDSTGLLSTGAVPPACRGHSTLTTEQRTTSQAPPDRPARTRAILTNSRTARPRPLTHGIATERTPTDWMDARTRTAHTSSSHGPEPRIGGRSPRNPREPTRHRRTPFRSPFGAEKMAEVRREGAHGREHCSIKTRERPNPSRPCIRDPSRSPSAGEWPTVRTGHRRAMEPRA